MLDEMIDGCRSVLGIPMAGFDSALFWELGTLAFMTRGASGEGRRTEDSRQCSTEMDTLTTSEIMKYTKQ